MKENFNVKGKDGAIAIFVLVGLLFMTSFLIISYGYNVNKSKIAKEQHNIISDIYSYKDGDANAYERAYTALRKQNKQTLTASAEDTSTLELEKTYAENLVNYRIYGRGNSVEPSKVTITDLTNQGFLPSSGAYPDTTDTRFPNATYEIIDIKKGQTFKFDYTGTNGSAGDYTTIGYIRVRCIDATTNEVVCDLVHNSGESITENDYYTTNLYYTYSTQQTDGIDGYVTAKKDFKIGIMYLLEKPDDFCIEIEKNLPEGYQQVEYIESECNQHIDTKVLTSKDIKIYAEAIALNNIKNTYSAALFGGRITSSNSNFSYVSGSAFDYLGIGNDFSEITRCSDFINKRIIEYSSKAIRVTCGEYEYYEEYDFDITEQMNIYLFSINQNNSVNQSGNWRMYVFKIWDNNVLVRNFIPSYRKSDSKAGLYDIVTNEFYTNLNTTNFIAGYNVDDYSVGDLITEQTDSNVGKYKIPIKITDSKGKSVIKDIILNKPLYSNDYVDYKLGKIIRSDGIEEIVNLPEILINEDYNKIEVLTETKPSKIDVEYVGYNLEGEMEGYTTLEYIESTCEQYIDTKILTSNNIKIYAEATALNNKYGTYSAALFGGRITNSNNNFSYVSGSDVDYIGIGNGFEKATKCNDFENKRIIEYSTKSIKVTCGDYEYNIEDDFEITQQRNIYLFAMNQDNSVNQSGNWRIHIFKIWNNNEIVRNFIPCKRDLDGVIGLYDTVTKEFYTNAGTGTFIAGPEV